VARYDTGPAGESLNFEKPRTRTEYDKPTEVTDAGTCLPTGVEDERAGEARTPPPPKKKNSSGKIVYGQNSLKSGIFGQIFRAYHIKFGNYVVVFLGGGKYHVKILAFC